MVKEEDRMKALEWNSAAVTACLEVLPEISEDQACYTYEVEKKGLTLRLRIHQFKRVAELALIRKRDGHALTRLLIFIRGGIYHHNDGMSEYLLVTDGIVASGRFAYLEWEEAFNQDRFPRGHDLMLAIDPDIRFDLMPSLDSYAR